jgi:A1 cistron-splicing factor AAR2
MKIIQGLRGPALTQVNIDKSSIVEEIIAKLGSPKELLGELQYCFITFLMGENLESFEQWKKLVNLLCSCQNSMF